MKDFPHIYSAPNKHHHSAYRGAIQYQMNADPECEGMFDKSFPVYEWLFENIGVFEEDWDLILDAEGHGYVNHLIAFKEVDDALAFKLRWHGSCL